MAGFSDKKTGLLNFMDLKSPAMKVLYWLFFIFMLAISLICLFPPIWVMLSGLKDIKEFLSVTPTIIPKSFHPEKLTITWKSLDFGRYYLNTLYLALGELAFCIIINGLGGYVLSRLKPKGSTLFFTLILWTMMMPTSMSMVPLFKIFLDFPILHVNITNTYFPMWLMAGANPFFLLVFKSFFDGIPQSYIEAAKLDGCSNMGIFARIIVPLSKPVIMVITIFSINSSWEQFFWPYLVLKKEDLYTVMVKIFTMKDGAYSVDMQIIALIFAIIPPVILFLCFQKHIMSGFTMSGIKG